MTTLMPFIREELIEARMFFGPDNIKGKSAEQISDIIYLLFMMIEVIRYYHPDRAARYADETLSYNTYDNMHYAGTDLGNLLAVLNNQDTFKAYLKTESKISIPLFQINRYLQSVRSRNKSNNDDATFFWKLEEYLKLYSKSLFRQLRRDAGRWEDLTHSDKVAFCQILRREFDKRAGNADIYLWFKQSFKLHESVNEDMYNFAGKKPGPLTNGSKPLYYFKTGKGSEYIQFTNGEVLRNKSDQGRGDTGLQPISAKVIFVESKQFALAVAEVIRNCPTLRRNINLLDGIASLTICEKSAPAKWRYADYRVLGGSAEGKIQSKFSRTPTVGYYVLDYDVPDSNGIHEAHPGHQVSEVSKYESVNESIDTKLDYHEFLNPALWDNEDLRAEVKDALGRIANKFAEFVDVKQIKIVDYIITGSNCGYNYTSQSDIDLHVLVDATALGKNPLTEPFLKAKKSLWNSGHDITVKNFTVELYAEDVNNEDDKLVATGVYSLLHDEWIKKPTYEAVTIDDQAVQAKAESIMQQIDLLVDGDSDADAEEIAMLWEHIRKMRRAGLEKGGEFSIENLAFKAVRNNGYFDKLRDYEQHREDEDLTLEHGQEDFAIVQ